MAAARRSTIKNAETAVRAPQVGVAVGAALLLAVVATLVLGIVPGEVLRAAQDGAHTLQAPAQISAPADPRPMR